jgi:glycosyltransferase involved in cell wall biosynthesis
MTTKIYFMRPPQSYGGPGSFQSRLENQLLELKCQINYHVKFRFSLIENIIIFSSSKHLIFLIYQKIRGARIILRLDGINTKHKFNKLNIKSYIYSELDNIVSICIARFLATTIIYQSEYVKNCWQKYGVPKNKNHFIIHNGVNIDDYSSCCYDFYQQDARICVIEGSIDDLVGIEILNSLSEKVDVYGKISDELKNKITNNNINIIGPVKREHIPEVLKKYKIFLLLEVNPACPNSLIEAMAAGLIPVGFKTGSVNEILAENQKFMAEYGSNSEKYEIPDLEKLNQKISNAIVSSNISNLYQEHARKNFDIKKIALKYFKIFTQ